MGPASRQKTFEHEGRMSLAAEIGDTMAPMAFLLGPSEVLVIVVVTAVVVFVLARRTKK
jgi:hypothetical protein